MKEIIKQRINQLLVNETIEECEKELELYNIHDFNSRKPFNDFLELPFEKQLKAILPKQKSFKAIIW